MQKNPKQNKDEERYLQWELSITKKMIKSFQKRVHWM